MSARLLLKRLFDSRPVLSDNTFHIEANNYFWVEFFGGEANLASNLTEAYQRLGYSEEDASSRGEALASRASDTSLWTSTSCKNQSYSCADLMTNPKADGQIKRKDVDADTAMLLATGWNYQQAGFAARGIDGNSTSPKFVVVKAEDVWDPEKCPSTLTLILNRTGMVNYTRAETSKGIECGDDPGTYTPEPQAPLGPMSVSDLTAIVAPALQLLEYDLSSFFLR